MKEYNLESYLSRGVANIVKGILKASAGNPKESFFLMQYAKESLEAGRLRKEAEERGGTYTSVPDCQYYAAV